jgi:class III poly(R)-hydroxyalkanoic acid synthase PhaE subunit
VGELPNADWMNQWQALSRQYLNAWQDAAQGGARSAPDATAPLRQGFEQWSRLFAPAGTQSETIERVVDSARRYAAFLQSAIGAVGMNAQGTGQPWADAMRQAFTGLATGAAPFEQAWRDAAGQMGAFAPLLSALRAAPGADASELKALLDLPTFGYLREHQERYQKSAVAWLDYQEQMRGYNALLLKAAQRGFELFEGKLAEREQPGRQIESLRALYDLWVDAAEEGYAEIALSTDFRETYGALVNAQMRVRAQVQQEVERIAADLGMPTRSEINSLGERLQALRREVRNRDGGTNQALVDEVAALRAEVVTLKAAMKKLPAADAVKNPPAAEAKPAARSQARERAAAPAPKAPRKKNARAGGKRARGAERAVAAVAAGNFASRIAKFANASLGGSAGTGKAGKKKNGKKR